MIVKLITFLFGKLTPEQKKNVLEILTKLASAAAQGAVAGAVNKK